MRALALSVLAACHASPRPAAPPTKPGGLFVYEYFAHDGDENAPAPGAPAKQFAGWEILRDEIVEAVPNWAADRAKIQRFVARKK